VRIILDRISGDFLLHQGYPAPPSIVSPKVYSIGGLFTTPLARSMAITNLKATPDLGSWDPTLTDRLAALGLCQLLTTNALHGCQDGGIFESGFVGDKHGFLLC
jgi:hypothetical protein